MVADPLHKTALTMLRYEQRFNVAVSRARDRVVLVRSVKRDELNPQDLKARLIAHFENPMPEIEASEDALAICESGFDRDLMRQLLERNYRVQGQVGALGFRIDMVVEGANGVRLAVECDGDRFHGPEQWRQDMRRQRVLERVGWRFWRCFASSYYRDQDGVFRDLLDTLSRLGIEPISSNTSEHTSRRYTEHRIVQAPRAETAPTETAEEPALSVIEIATIPEASVALGSGIGVGDKVVIVFSDNARRLSVRLSDFNNDNEKGWASVSSPLGQALLGKDEGEEIEIDLGNGRTRKALVESVEKRVSVADAPTPPEPVSEQTAL